MAIRRSSPHMVPHLYVPLPLQLQHHLAATSHSLHRVKRHISKKGRGDGLTSRAHNLRAGLAADHEVQFTMILSPYRNPAYRPPMLRHKPSSPGLLSTSASGDEEIDTQDTIHLAQVNMAGTPTILPETGESSPRSKAADRLQLLHIDHTSNAEQDVSPPSKRIKRLQFHQSAAMEHNYATSSSPRSGCISGSIRASASLDRSPSPEVPDTPLITLQDDERTQNYGRVFGTLDQAFPTRKPQNPFAMGRQYTPPHSPGRSHATKRSHSSCSDRGSKESVDMGNAPESPASLPPGETNEPPDLDRTALTWQDDEITGHLVDETSPYDDGEGINGIGFQPTPSMAYARSQRRRQQISEWKVREAREARQKRAERRQGASASTSRVTRKVRFG